MKLKLKYLGLCLFSLLLSSVAGVTDTSLRADIKKVFHGGVCHAGLYPDAVGALSKRPKWKFKSGGKIFSSPAIAGNLVYFGSEDHFLYAVNKHTGKLAWKLLTGGPVASTAAIDKQRLFFLSFDGFLYCVDKGTGHLFWKFKTGGEKYFGQKALWGMKPANQYMSDQYDFFLSSPLVYNINDKVMVCIGSSDGRLYTLDAGTGKLIWSFKTNGIIHTSPAIFDHKIYFGSWDTYLYALNAYDGQLIWKFKTKDHPVYHQLDGIQSSPCLSNGMVYFGCRDGHLYALNANTGRLQWKYDTNGSWVLTTPSVKGANVFFGTSDSDLLIAADAKTGKKLFQFSADGYIYSSPAISGQSVFFGDFSGELHRLSTINGKEIEKFETDGRKSNGAAVLNKGKIDFGFLAVGLDVSLYSTSEKVLEKQYLAGPVVSSPVVDESVLYFGSADGCLYALQIK